MCEERNFLTDSIRPLKRGLWLQPVSWPKR